MEPYLENMEPNKKDCSLFYSAKSLFEFFLNFYNTDKHKFVVNLFINMNPFNIRYFTHGLCHECINTPCGLIVNKEDLNIKGEEDLQIISYTIMSNMAVCISEYFSDQKTKQEAQSYFYRTLEILESGLTKKEAGL